MSKQIPEMLESFSQLVAAPSVSSTDPQWDQSNRGVIDLLAGWLEDIGFNVEILPVPAEPAPASGHPRPAAFAAFVRAPRQPSAVRQDRGR